MHANLQPLSKHLFRWRSGLAGVHHPVNSYVFLRDEGAILIDPAADLTPSVLETSGAGRALAILLTHVQEENAAGVYGFPDVPVYVPSGEEYLCQGLEAYRRRITPWPAPWDWETRGNYQGHIAGAANERPLHVAIGIAGTLTHGQTICGLRVIGTPGHGKHAVSLVAEIDGKTIAFCGDIAHAGGSLWNWFDSEWDYGLQNGIRTLRASAKALSDLHPAIVCPAHGPLIRDPERDLSQLCHRLDCVLAPLSTDSWEADSTRWPATPTAAAGWFQLLPGLYQWRPDGNAALLVSATGAGLMIDDGLCHWVDLDERERHHRDAIARIKQVTGVQRIEIVIPTHYHGDHTENIPDLAAQEQAAVISLDLVADPIEHPERYSLSSMLPWYGTRHDLVKIDQRVSSGHRLRWHEFEIEIFHLGGQTWHHAGMLVTIAGHRVAFVGDSINSTPDCPPVLCYNDCEPEHRGWAYALDRLLERTPDLLVCGHGSAIGTPMPLLRAARQNWETRLGQYRSLCPRADLRLFFDPVYGRESDIAAAAGASL